MFATGSDDSNSDKDMEENLQSQMTCSFIPRADRVYMYAATQEMEQDVETVKESSILCVYCPLHPIGPKGLLPRSQKSSRTPTIKIFNWKKFPDPPIPPEERREFFSNIDCGSTAPFPTPYDAFVAIWDNEIMQHIVIETNKYAQHLANIKIAEGTLGPTSRIKDWTDTNADELYVLFAIMLGMGIVVKGNLREYWSKEFDLFETPGFNKYMNKNRYELLSQCLHFSENNVNLRHMSQSKAQLFKIAPIVKHLNQKFQMHYKLDRNIVIDESFTEWKGWLSLKYLTKNNVKTAENVNTFELCESQTGYLWRFEVCTDIVAPSSRASRYIPKLVLKILDGLEHRGHTVWMENYFNSPPLARELKKRGFDCVGTLKLNCKEVPQELACLKKEQMEVRSVYGCTSGDVDVMVFRDQNLVGLISTYHGISINTKNEKPIALTDYTACVDGIDKKDQLLAIYPIARKRFKEWYKKMFSRLLNVSVVNSHILHKKSSSSDHTIMKIHREFRKQLVTQMLAKHASRQPKGPKVLPYSSSGAILLPSAIINHFPKEYGYKSGNSGEKIRRSCVKCRKRIQTYCPECNVPLCAFTCYKTYHAPDSS